MYPTIDMKATGNRLRQIMNQRNLTVKDIQKYLDLSCVQSVYRWMNGYSMPSIDHLYALSELFRVSVDDIIVGNKGYLKRMNRSFYVRMVTYYSFVKALMTA